MPSATVLAAGVTVSRMTAVAAPALVVEAKLTSPTPIVMVSMFRAVAAVVSIVLPDP